MFLWFVGCSVALVWLVFSSPALDYRLVVLGAVLPLAELVVGEPRVLHTLGAPVLVLGVVMAGTRSRLGQRRWLSLPIGLFVHLLLDGIWTDTTAFWWPFSGRDFSTSTLPEIGRGTFDVVLELVGAMVMVWCWRTFDLGQPSRRSAFVRTGRLERAPVGRG